MRPLWKLDSFLWISDKKQIHLLNISDKKQTPPCKKSDNFNCFPTALWLHRKRFFPWPFFGVLSHLVDLYLISNEEPSKGKKQIYCSNTTRFACQDAILSKSGNFDQNQTKNQTFLKEKSDIRPGSAKVDHSGRTVVPSHTIIASCPIILLGATSIARICEVRLSDELGGVEIVF